MTLNLDDALQTFIAESRELLQQMEDALLQIEQAPGDPDTINAIFRAAHTIKGSAGLFGLDAIVAFTHVAENVLDRVRDGELAVDEDLAALLLAARDHIGTLVEAAAEGREPDEDTQVVGASLVARLQAFLGAGAAPSEGRAIAQVEPSIARSGGGEVETDHWHISLRFGRDVLRHGMDPLSFIRYLGTLGRLVSIVTLTDAVPSAAEMDPESCYLGFEIAFSSNADKAAIEDAFEFVREDSLVRILPPHSKTSEYLDLIRELPEEDMRLGEILVRCGTLTRAELENVLARQASADEQPPRPIGQVLVEQHIVQPPVIEAALEKQQQVKDNRRAENALIRVDANKLDQLINLIGELIIAGAGASLAAHRAGASELVEATTLLSRLVEEVRDSALTLRMVQIGATFNRFHRVVRDVSRELGKEVDLVIEGADTELDKTVVEKIGDPLMHLVRNALDHGIKTPDYRIARGKPRRGTLTLSARHEAGSVVIEVADDGAGLNRTKILAKARERGLVAPDAPLTDHQIDQLIFAPGFSTADQVSNISGRGVGMDVVRRNIEELGGSIEVYSWPDNGELIAGKGSRFRVRLPLTLAIIDGFLIGVGKASYIIPLNMVVECIEISSAETSAQRGRHYLNLRGEVLPFIRLRELFEIDDEPPRRENVVVVQFGEKRAGLVVDQLMGEFQTVIKPLGQIFAQVRGIGGFTILGNGEVALILDVPGLVKQVTAGRIGDGRALEATGRR